MNYILLIFIPIYWIYTKHSSSEKIHKCCPLLNDEDSINWVKSSKVAFVVKNKSIWNKIQKMYKSHTIDSTSLKAFQKDLMEHRRLKNIIFDGNGQNLLSLIRMATNQSFMTLTLDEICQCESRDSATWPFDPNFMGWFWNDDDQIEFHNFGKRCLDQLLERQEIRDQFEYMTNKKDLSNYWIVQRKRLHVTDMYFGAKMTDKARKYYENVQDYIHKTVAVTVSGVLLTPRTFSGHVLLAPETESIFPDKDDVQLLPHVTLAVSSNYSAVQSGYDQMKIQRKIRDDESYLREFTIDLGDVQDWGDGQFYVKLSKPLSFDVLLSPVY